MLTKTKFYVQMTVKKTENKYLIIPADSIEIAMKKLHEHVKLKDELGSLYSNFGTWENDEVLYDIIEATWHKV